MRLRSGILIWFDLRIYEKGKQRKGEREGGRGSRKKLNGQSKPIGYVGID